MAKHRSTVFTVVREEIGDDYIGVDGTQVVVYTFSAIIGTYLSLQRAEEVAAASLQAFKDAGVSDGSYRFSVQIGTYYDE